MSMYNIDWAAKLTSRKFWMALAGFVGGLILALGGTEQTSQQTVALIMSGASVIAYILGEGMADAAGAQQTVTYLAKEDEPPDADIDDLK